MIWNNFSSESFVPHHKIQGYSTEPSNLYVDPRFVTLFNRLFPGNVSNIKKISGLTINQNLRILHDYYREITGSSDEWLDKSSKIDYLQPKDDKKGLIILGESTYLSTRNINANPVINSKKKSDEEDLDERIIKAAKILGNPGLSSEHTLTLYDLNSQLSKLTRINNNLNTDYYNIYVKYTDCYDELELMKRENRQLKSTTDPGVLRAMSDLIDDYEETETEHLKEIESLKKELKELKNSEDKQNTTNQEIVRLLDYNKSLLVELEKTKEQLNAMKQKKDNPIIQSSLNNDEKKLMERLKKNVDRYMDENTRLLDENSDFRIQVNQQCEQINELTSKLKAYEKKKPSTAMKKGFLS